MTTSTEHSNIMLSEEEDIRALELFERRHELTDDELQELAASPAMQDAMLDLMDIADAYTSEESGSSNINTEGLNDENTKAKTVSFNFRKLIYVAACIMALIALVVWNRMSPETDTIGQDSIAQQELPEGVIFKQQDNSMGVTLSTVDGANVTPALQSVGNSVVADFTELQTAEAQEVKMDVPMGYDATVTLPDGSVAYLHPGSRLKFPTKFTGGTRQVILEGECYFKVHHDASHPFIVSANGVLTTVLGTEFNVTTNGMNGTTVTLVNGSVRVNDEMSEAMVVITPGQQAFLSGSKFVTKSVDTSIYEAWRDGFICYDNMPMSDVMEAIGKNYNMTVQFNNREAMHTSIRFVCERKASIDEAIALINSLRKADVKRQGSVIVVE